MNNSEGFINHLYIPLKLRKDLERIAFLLVVFIKLTKDLVIVVLK